MVLTITVVGNNQPGPNNAVPGHTVLSPNELAQLMSGQTVTGLLNPDGSITLNSNVMSTQQMTAMPANIQNMIPPITSSAGPNYASHLATTNAATDSINNNIQPIMDDPNCIGNGNALNNNNNHSQVNSNNSSATTITTNTTTTTTTTPKKTGQKRLTAKQKLAQQQQKQQQQQMQMQQQQQIDTRQQIITTQSDPTMNQQPQIVATVQLPNGQIGQLIAPSGGQFWSPNAINLQQLSMAVAAATGTIPQTMTIPGSTTNQQSIHQQHQQPQQLDNSMMQHQQGTIQNGQQLQQQVTQQQQSTQQQHSNNNNNNNNNNGNNPNQQHVLTTVQVGSNNIGQVVGRPGPNQIWSSGPISLSQLSALAQQGVVQLSPVQGVPNGPNGQRMMEMVPQAAIQGMISQTGQPLQAIPLASGGQYITQDPNDPNKWQIVQPAGPMAIANPQQQQGIMPIPTSSASNGDSSRIVNSYSPFVNTSNNNNSMSASNNNSSSNNSNNNNTNNINQNVLGDNTQATQPQRKLKRLACTCPNCRDGDNSRGGGDKKKQHICHFPDCNKVYGKTSHLRAHLRWHSGERPYVCNWSFCGKKFTRSDELQRHRRTHTGEKRFQCSECLKRFMRSDHLSKHLKTHLSSKKCGTVQSPQQLQAQQQEPPALQQSQLMQRNSDEMSNMITMVDRDQIKLEENMIDNELALESMEDANKQQLDHSSIEVNNSN